MGVPLITPLCPAGHLPHKGGDRLEARRCHDSISPLVGEMPGRAEGGEPNPLRPETQA